MGDNAAYLNLNKAFGALSTTSPFSENPTAIHFDEQLLLLCLVFLITSQYVFPPFAECPVLASSYGTTPSGIAKEIKLS